MTAAPARLPHDLQARLDVILAKPLLRRAPALAQAIEILVRNAYGRQPHPVLTGDQQDLLDELLQIPIGNSDTGDRGYERIPGTTTAPPGSRESSEAYRASREARRTGAKR